MLEFPLQNLIRTTTDIPKSIRKIDYRSRRHSMIEQQGLFLHEDGKISNLMRLPKKELSKLAEICRAEECYRAAKIIQNRYMSR